MRQVTATEKYLAVLEGKMAKKEFVRQMRQQYPMYVSNYDGFDSTVQILRTRKMLFEAPQKAFSGVKVYDDRPALTYSLDALDRGIRYELSGMGLDPATDRISPEQLSTATKKAKDNLEKDANHYLNLLSGESSKTDKHDREEEVKRGEAKKDVFNGEKKAALKESIESAKENIIKVASVIRGKYGEIPGFNGLLKDFLQTHQDDIKAGKVIDPVGEFDDFVDLNYDRLDEKDHDGYNTDPNTTMHIDDEEWEEEMGRSVKEKYDREEEDGHVGTNTDDDFEREMQQQLAQRESKGKDHDGDGDIDSDDYMIAKDKAIKKAMGKDVNEMSSDAVDALIGVIGAGGLVGGAVAIKRLLDALEAGKLGEKGKAVAQYLAKAGSAAGSATQKHESQEEQLKEAVKSIIKKTLSEGTLNEAATNELARLADDYAEFDGMKQTIVALQNVVTEIESFYDKTREKIQKIYDSIGEVRNEEGLKVGAFLAPSIESAFNKDLRPVTKLGFTKGLETPKVKMISKAEVDAARATGEIEEEPKQTMFTPVNENKK